MCIEGWPVSFRFLRFLAASHSSGPRRIIGRLFQVCPGLLDGILGPCPRDGVPLWRHLGCTLLPGLMPRPPSASFVRLLTTLKPLLQTYPPVVLLYRSLGFMSIILAAAEYYGRCGLVRGTGPAAQLCGTGPRPLDPPRLPWSSRDFVPHRLFPSRRHAWLQPRDVPHAITAAVVAAGLGIIVLDGVFSQVRTAWTPWALPWSCCTPLDARRLADNRLRSRAPPLA